MALQYLLVAVDCFSRKASVVPLKGQNRDSQIKQALVKVFSDLGEPERMQTDKGTEFHNKIVKEFLQKHQVHCLRRKTAT